jgi:ketosteroid isomerase-like protein
MTNSQAAVQSEIEAAYARAGEAYRAKDAAALMGMVAPGFAQRMPDGQVIDAAEAEAALREWFETTDQVTRYGVRIGSLRVVGDEAVAEVTEDVTTTFADPTGKSHERVQANTADVTWVRMPTGWQIQRTEYRTAKLMVDGKPVTPFYTGAGAAP